MKNLALFLTILIPFTFAFTRTDSSQVDSCPEPSNVHTVLQSANSVVFDWDDCDCSEATYHVYYVKNGESSGESVTESSEFTFSNLSAGSYRFFFYTTCLEGTASIIVEDIVMI